MNALVFVIWPESTSRSIKGILQLLCWQVDYMYIKIDLIYAHDNVSRIILKRGIKELAHVPIMHRHLNSTLAHACKDALGLIYSILTFLRLGLTWSWAKWQKVMRTLLLARFKHVAVGITFLRYQSTEWTHWLCGLTWWCHFSFNHWACWGAPYYSF